MSCVSVVPARARACPPRAAPPRVPDPRFCFPVNAVEAVEFTVEKTCCRGGLQQLYIYHTSPQAAPGALQLYSALQRSTALYSSTALHPLHSTTLYTPPLASRVLSVSCVVRASGRFFCLFWTARCLLLFVCLLPVGIKRHPRCFQGCGCRAGPWESLSTSKLVTASKLGSHQTANSTKDHRAPHR